MKKLFYSLQLTAYSLILLFSATAAVAWEIIPAYPQAEKFKEEEILVNNTPIKTTIYRSSSPAEEILGFYKDRFSAQGWVVESEVNQQGTILVNFSQENKFINIVTQQMQGESFTTLVQGERAAKTPGAILKSAQDCPECGEAPQEDAPGRELHFLPRYPGAVRVSTVERKQSGKVDLAYSSQDAPEKILDYYYNAMPNRGWAFVEEISLETLNSSSLIFEGPYGRCLVSVVRDPQNVENTIIGVKYNGQ